MAAPNLMALTTVNIKLARLAVTDTEQNLIAAVTSNHAVVVEAIFCTNIHATVVGWVTVIHRRSSTDITLANQKRIPVKDLINVLPTGKPLYLEEGDSVKIYANQNNNVTAWAPYSDMV